MTIRQRVRDARARAFARYAQKYGELHPRDPRTDEILFVGSEEFVTELLRRANNGEPYPETDLSGMRPYDPRGPYV